MTQPNQPTIPTLEEKMGMHSAEAPATAPVVETPEVVTEETKPEEATTEEDKEAKGQEDDVDSK